MLETIEGVLAHLPPLVEIVATLSVVVLGGVVRGFTGFGAACLPSAPMGRLEVIA